jgi:anthranilate synthase
MTTRDGVRVTRTATPFDPAELGRIAALVDERRGGVMSSGMEYPGRYSRWHMAYADPCAEIVATGRRVTVRALNDRGRVLLPVIRAALLRSGQPEPAEPVDEDTVVIGEDDREFTEEERSRRPTVFTALREITAAFGCEDPHLGLYGAFGYDLAFQFEPVRLRLDRPATQRDLVLHLPDEIWVLDRKREEAVRFSYDFEVGGVSTAGLDRRTAGTLAGHAPRPVRDSAAPGGRPPQAPPDELPRQPQPGSYARVVEEARERFARGDLFEVVPGHVFYGRCASPAAFYELLRQRNPAPYEFLFNLGDGEYLVGASPEMYVRVTGDRVETCPIAGTIARGEDTLEDAANIATLLGSAKEESELTMCTDVDRNDKARVCVPGTVRVIGRRQIEMYSRLIHTVDHIEGRLRPGFDAFDAFLTHMWAVTVTGAPKTWAMQFIEDHEETPRRWYGGAVGKIGFDGSMNTGLTLRTAHITGGIAAVRAGATLLYDSVPEAEEKETQIKARALLETLEEAGRIARDPLGPLGTAVESGRARVTTPDYHPRVLLVDHQDSFVHTLGDYFRQQGAEVTTLRFGFSPALLDSYAPDLVVMSPGPGRPADFGCAALLDEVYARHLRVFGVCLGLQAMVEHAGGALSLLPEPAHGKPGLVRVSGGSLLSGLPAEFTAGRYHSLYAPPAEVRGGFAVTASLRSPQGSEVVMAIEDDQAGRWAVQFHPESILTASGRTGHQIIANVLDLCRARDHVAPLLLCCGMRSVEPEVFLVARPKVDYDAMAAYLREVGGERWLERIDRGQLEAQDLAEFAGKMCYRSWEPGLNPNVRKVRDDQAAYLQNILRQQHGSVLEHASFSFVLHNVSRVFTHEIARHRPGTAISQESLRYVRLDELPFWFPEWAREDAELMKRATALLTELEQFQQWMAGHFGLDDDDTKMHEKKHKTSFMRRFAPEGLATGLVWTANIRTLRHTIEARTDQGAEEEIRLVFGKIGEIMRAEAPALFGDYTVTGGTWIPGWRKV